MEQVTKIELFPFMDAFFGPTANFDKIANSEKERHSFMLMQYLSKDRPDIVCQFGANVHYSIVDHLHHHFRYVLKITRQPNWSFGKGISSKKRHLHSSFPPEVVDLVMQELNFEYKTILTLSEKYPSMMTSVFKEAEQNLKMQVKKSK